MHGINVDLHFLTLRSVFLLLAVVEFAGMGAVVPNSAWGLRYPPWRGHSRKILIEKIPGEEEL